jgi:uncharacterized protein YqgC (DUF456 family)
MVYAKSFINQAQEIKKKDANAILTDATKGAMVGSAIGAGVGFFIAFGRHKNLLLGSFIGAVIGGVISSAFIAKK